MSIPPATTRLFLALWPDPPLRELLRAARDAWSWPRSATPVPTDKLHLTLHFLGNLPSLTVPDLVRGLAVPFTPFELSFGEPKLWPHGIAVLEPTTEPEPLLALHAALGQALAGCGLQPEERAFRPHVTMARRAAGAPVPVQGPAFQWKVDGYALVASTPGQGSYTVCQRYS